MVKDKAVPEFHPADKEIPTGDTAERALPVSGNEENMVLVGGRMIEIRPTKLKYMRNRTAMFYQI